MDEGEVIDLENNLQPCTICGRTFLPEPLKKHTLVCEKNATRKRRVFDSLKQRLEGTEFVPYNKGKYKRTPNESKAKRSSWKEKHFELMNTIRAARGAPLILPEMPASPRKGPGSASSSTTSDRCPTCDRKFGPRAYDRHVEWCKQQKAKAHKSPADTLLAKERLEARTKYRVPLPSKSKRSLVRDKYSATPPKETGKSASCVTLPQSPLMHKETKTRDKVDNLLRKDVKIALHESASKGTKDNTTNPFATAERQLMELLECDDFKPFISKSAATPHTQRPYTSTIIKSKYVVKPTTTTVRKLPENGKRASVIEPPSDFQDNIDFLNADFETIETFFNRQLDGLKNLKNADDDHNSHVVHNAEVKFNNETDVAAIDPKLINNNDNLQFTHAKLVAPHTRTPTIKNNLVPDDVVHKTSTTTPTRTNPSSQPSGNNRKIKGKKQSTSFNSSSMNNAHTKPTYLDKYKNLKRSMSLLDPINMTPMSRNLRHTNEQHEIAKEEKYSSVQDLRKENADKELFSVDDELYEEYKKYEEMYLKEKESQKTVEAPSGPVTPTEEVKNPKNITAETANMDSAYSSLNRKTKRVRARATKLAPLENQMPPQATLKASSTSSSSETLSNTTSRNASGQKMSKFCHECGNKYPISSAKFCVECGVRRLIL